MHRQRDHLLALSVALALVLIAVFSSWAQTPPQAPASQDPSVAWWKGNLHTHSLWSDGDDYPEMIADWYKQAGYHFLALSDHNILSQGQKWIDPVSSRGGTEALKKYQERFGPGWVEERELDGTRLVRLKPLGEFRHLLEESGGFLMIQSEEITDRFRNLPVHLNATNLLALIVPRGGSSVREVIENNVNAVLEQRQETGQPMFVHVNHPNFGWALTAEDLAAVAGERFFEVYNGHPAVHNAGDELHAGTERMWDIILTLRLAELGGDLMYGVATDDAHHYHELLREKSNPGRGWVVVRAARLTPESIVAAMESGDFYASTGVSLSKMDGGANEVRLEVQPEKGVTYTTQFIGTRKEYDRRTEPVLDEDGNEVYATRRYSDEIGEVLAEVEGIAPSYTFTGEELYVRAKVVSSKPTEHSGGTGEVEACWTQPVIPGPEQQQAARTRVPPR